MKRNFDELGRHISRSKRERERETFKKIEIGRIDRDESLISGEKLKFELDGSWPPSMRETIRGVLGARGRQWGGDTYARTQRAMRRAWNQVTIDAAGN